MLTAKEKQDLVGSTTRHSFHSHWFCIFRSQNIATHRSLSKKLVTTMPFFEKADRWIHEPTEALTEARPHAKIERNQLSVSHCKSYGRQRQREQKRLNRFLFEAFKFLVFTPLLEPTYSRLDVLISLSSLSLSPPNPHCLPPILCLPNTLLGLRPKDMPLCSLNYRAIQVSL